MFLCMLRETDISTLWGRSGWIALRVLCVVVFRLGCVVCGSMCVCLCVCRVLCVFDVVYVYVVLCVGALCIRLLQLHSALHTNFKQLTTLTSHNSTHTRTHIEGERGEKGYPKYTPQQANINNEHKQALYKRTTNGDTFVPSITGINKNSERNTGWREALPVTSQLRNKNKETRKTEREVTTQ